MSARCMPKYRTDSREWVPVEITANVQLDDQPIQIAFKWVALVTTSDEETLEWFDAEWIGAEDTTREARVMIGPGASPSTGVLSPGTYDVMVRLEDNPEIPVFSAYRIMVT